MQQVNLAEFYKTYQIAISIVVASLVSVWVFMPLFGDAIGGMVMGLSYALIGFSGVQKGYKVTGWAAACFGLFILALGIALQFKLYPA